MVTEVKRRRGSTVDHQPFTGAVGEVTVDTTKNTVVVHDGSTQQGIPLLKENYENTPSPVAGYRNHFINGKFDIWQKGTQFSGTSGFIPAADRWFVWANAVTALSVSRQLFTISQTQVPYNPKYFTRITISQSVAGDDGVSFFQPIENVEALAGKTVTVSFYAKAESAKTIGYGYVQIFNDNNEDNHYVTLGTLSLTTAWQKYVVTFDVDSVVDKNVIRTESNRFEFVVILSNAAQNMRNSGIFDLAQFQIEEGSVATPFEKRPRAVEFALCERYYEKSYNAEIAPATLNQREGAFHKRHQGSGTYTWAATVKFSTAKVKIPTVTVYSTFTGTAADQTASFLNGTNNATSAVSMTIYEPNNNSFVAGRTATYNINDYHEFHWVANSDYY